MRLRSRFQGLARKIRKTMAWARPYQRRDMSKSGLTKENKKLVKKGKHQIHASRKKDINGLVSE